MPCSATLDTFTVDKSCKAVRDRFTLPLQSRGPAWNCLEIEDNLPGFKGPLSLKHGGSVIYWQSRSSNSSTRDRFNYSALLGAKRVDKWLLVSEANSGSMAHVDVGFETWVSCLAGKKLSGFETQTFTISVFGLNLAWIAIISVIKIFNNVKALEVLSWIFYTIGGFPALCSLQRVCNAVR